MEPQWKIQAQGIGEEAKYEFPGKEGIEAQWFLGMKFDINEKLRHYETIRKSKKMKFSQWDQTQG
jgi:hypothetical protein